MIPEVLYLLLSLNGNIPKISKRKNVVTFKFIHNTNGFDKEYCLQVFLNQQKSGVSVCRCMISHRWDLGHSRLPPPPLLLLLPHLTPQIQGSNIPKYHVFHSVPCQVYLAITYFRKCLLHKHKYIVQY